MNRPTNVFFVPWVEGLLDTQPRTFDNLYQKSYDQFSNLLEVGNKCPYCGMTQNNCGCGYLKGDKR